MPAIITAIPQLAPRAADSHKGTFGTVLVMAGSRGMSGAAILCGSAALRSGAGLVCVAAPCEIQNLVASGNPCYTTFGIPHHADGSYSGASLAALLDRCETASVLAIGPGIGNRSDVKNVVHQILEKLELPVVLDADGLNVLDPIPDFLKARKQPLILTPHPGEFARLTKTSIEHVQANRAELALTFAKKWKTILVLKGASTIVTDGERIYTNSTGNPGMATGGTGDVLTGIIAALLAQKMEAFDAAVLAVHVHGQAGDLAALEIGPIAMTASDVLNQLPAAWRAL